MKVGQTFYMDYQASTPTDPRVVEAMLPYFYENFANPHSNDHILGWRSNQAIESSRREIAALINADPDEIIFTSGATESNNTVFQGISSQAKYKNRNKILISSVEHKCVIEAAKALSLRGFSVLEIPVDSSGIIDLHALQTLLDDSVLIVSVMAVNNEMGATQPLEMISSLCKRVGAMFHSDCAQALATMEIDVEQYGLDFVSLSAHKIYGPKGIGALYINRANKKLLSPLILGGGQEDGLRSGTLSTSNCVGFGKACQIINDEGNEEPQKIENIRNLFYGILTNEIPFITLNGPSLGGYRHSGNLNLCFNGIDAKELLGSVQPYIAASTGSACTSGTPEPSYVLRRMGLSDEQAASSIRFSFGRFSTEEDAVDAANIIIRQVNKMHEYYI